MATTFLEPGGDATFNVASITNGGFWGAVAGSPSAATDALHGNHTRSIKYRAALGDLVTTPSGTLADTGSRISFYTYINSLPDTTASIIFARNSSDAIAWNIRMTNNGVLQLWNGVSAQIGTDGAKINTGGWYRISLAYTITDGTHNRFELFVNGTSSISITNATLTNTGTTKFLLGNGSTNTTLDFRSSDHYIDDSNSLTDPGDIWVTAKRPNANGTVNNFVTQIGSGGSGYGSGHSPQVNERPLSTTNGWSVVAVGATTEEYNIESASTGDIVIQSYDTIVDYMGWVYAKALLSETASIRVNNSDSNISLTSTITMFTKAAGSTTYPAGTGTDIGMVTDATATTVSLYECGIMVAYIPGTAPAYLVSSSWLKA